MQHMFMQGNGFGSGGGFRPLNFRPVMLGQQGKLIDQQAVTTELPAPGTPIQPQVRVKAGYEQMPSDARRTMPFQPKQRDPMQFALRRICSIMTRTAESEVDPEVRGHLFWSYARHSKNEAAFLKSFGELCPSIPVPPKPTQPEKVMVADSPDKVGFHGKTQITFQEAKELLAALDEVLKPLTPEESASDLGKEQCLRDFSAGNFPIVESLRDDLFDFVAAGDTGATFEISKGQVVVAGKAIDCAVAIGRGKVIRTAATVGGIGAGAGLLWLLLL